ESGQATRMSRSGGCAWRPAQAAARTGEASGSAGSAASAHWVRRFSRGLRKRTGSFSTSNSEWMNESIARSHHLGSFIHSELLVLTLPVLFLNPRLKRRTQWADA